MLITVVTTASYPVNNCPEILSWPIAYVTLTDSRSFSAWTYELCGVVRVASRSGHQCCLYDFKMTLRLHVAAITRPLTALVCRIYGNQLVEGWPGKTDAVGVVKFGYAIQRDGVNLGLPSEYSVRAEWAIGMRCFLDQLRRSHSNDLYVASTSHLSPYNLPLLQSHMTLKPSSLVANFVYSIHQLEEGSHTQSWGQKWGLKRACRFTASL